MTKGLVAKEDWIEQVLSGAKTWDIRCSRTRVRGTVALIDWDSGYVVGVANIVDCLGPLSKDKLANNIDKHQISLTMITRRSSYPQPYAWVLEDAKRLMEPIYIEHPKGHAVWVDLNIEVDVG